MLLLLAVGSVTGNSLLSPSSSCLGPCAKLLLECEQTERNRLLFQNVLNGWIVSRRLLAFALLGTWSFKGKLNNQKGDNGVEELCGEIGKLMERGRFSGREGGVFIEIGGFLWGKRGTEVYIQPSKEP